MSARIFKSTVQKRTISKTGGVATADTKFTLDSTDTLPTDYPYTMVIDPDLTTEEIVTVTGSTGSANEFNITRGQDGTTAQDHSNGSYVKHMITGRDMGEPQKHIEATGAYSILNNGENSGVTTTNIVKTLHGIGTGEGVVVGTDKTQTLTAKTLTSPTINTPVISGGSSANATVTGASISTSTITGGTVTGTITNSGTISGGSYWASNISLSTGGNLNLGVSKTNTLTADGVNIKSTEVAYLSGVTSSIQTQIDNTSAAATAWTSYTPSISGTGWTLGTGTPLAGSAYKQVGKTVHFRIVFTFGNGTAGGSGLSFGLPSGLTPIQAHVGQCISITSSSRFSCEALITTSNTVIPFATPLTAGAVNRNITTNVPFTWSTGDSLTISGTYEVA